MAIDSFHTRVHALKSQLQAKGLNAWLQPVNDEFQSEYVPSYAERLPFLCGFTGSAGMGIVSHETNVHSELWVDGRYVLQAPQEIPKVEWVVKNSSDITLSSWAQSALPQGAVVGCDAWLHTHAQVLRWEKQLSAQGQMLKPLLSNLVDVVWDNKPATPASAAEILPIAYTGKPASEKIVDCVAWMAAKQLRALVLTQPDAICWLLNIRAGDIPFNPLLLAYALVLDDGRVVLLTHPRTWAEDVLAYFKDIGVFTHTFAQWFVGDALAASYGLAGAKVGIDPSSAAHAWWGWAANAHITLVDIEDPTQLAKAAKSSAEQEGMREAHRMDAVALVTFLAEQSHVMPSGNLSELDMVARLEAARARNPAYRGPSFATIAGSGPNGAIVHYRASEASNRMLQRGEFFLLDSGGQYRAGTTDITRTLAVGEVNAEMKDRYTRVLKGHIALAMARFPKGTSGRQLDTLARYVLWEVGCDYDHGTGHGVGSFLCVHEGPQRISKKGSDIALQAGMVISNEPGYYKAGEYGIRIENLVLVVESAHGLAFETLTLVPIDTAPIDMSLMRADEIAWLNDYHARVLAKIGPRIADADVKAWLEAACAPI